jgi:hypothetical protein
MWERRLAFQSCLLFAVPSVHLNRDQRALRILHLSENLLPLAGAGVV